MLQKVVILADFTVFSSLATTMLAMMPANNHGSEMAPVEASPTDHVTSQVLTSLYSVSSYTQDDRGTDFKSLSVLLELLRVSEYIPVLGIERC